MKIYKKENVFNEALYRIRRIFDEFEDVVVSYSGGKDSTAIFNLALMIAREKNRLPLKVMFLDQEAEFSQTIDQVKMIMYSEEVEPYWLQIPIKIFNATSFKTHWLHCWEKDAEWLREKDDIAKKENIYGKDRFADMFYAIAKKEWPDKKVAYLAGVRCEESPARYVALTGVFTYKDITWGKILNKKEQKYTFYPLYDWSYSDIWKAIFDNKWEYNKIYNYQYQYGVKTQHMRVSNLNHETAVHALFYLQEVDPELYNKLADRLDGVHTAGKMGVSNFFVKELPFMFANWKEYRDFLLVKLLDNTYHEKFKKKFADHDIAFMNESDKIQAKIHKQHVSGILTNDWEFVKIGMIDARPENIDIMRKHRKNKRESKKCGMK